MENVYPATLYSELSCRKIIFYARAQNNQGLFIKLEVLIFMNTVVEDETRIS